MSYIDDFRTALISRGIVPPDHILDDGKLHRCDAEGGKGKGDAAYLLHSDGVPAGGFENWRDGLGWETWCSKERTEMSEEEKRAFKARVEASKRERELEEARLREEARQRAEAIWMAAGAANDDHPYLTRKGVRSFGLRLHKGLVVVPMRDTAGVLRSLQFISDEGKKIFLKHGEKRGCYATIGKPSSKIFIAEGYATAATIHEATGEAVVIAFDAGNLEPVAKAMREKFHDLEIIIAADNDRFTKRPNGDPWNPGIEAGRMAAQAVNGRMIYPEFSEEAEGSDFNDLATSSGYEAVMQIIEPAANDNLPAVAPVTSATVDFFSPLPDSPKGKPLSTIENLEEIVRRLGVHIRYNVIKKEEEIIIPGERFSIDNGANASLAWLTSWVSRFKMPTGNIGDYVTYISDQNLYNPVTEWVNSRPWDGVPRFQAFCDTVTAVGEAANPNVKRTKETLMRRWMISAIAAAFRPNGVSAHGVLVFQGAQYLGKTAWFKRLVPESLGVIADGFLIDPKDKDSVKQAVSNWLVELGEIDATFRKADVAQLKSFITKDKDVLRRAYAKRESAFARRTVFFASVNPREYLHDPTGNRRYWTIECEHLDHHHDLDMQQVWAEVFEFFNTGETWFLQPEEMLILNDHNKDFEVHDPLEERLQTILDWSAPSEIWEWKTVTEILITVGMDKPNVGDARRAGEALRKLNGNQSKRGHGGTRRLLVPPKVSDRSGPF